MTDQRYDDVTEAFDRFDRAERLSRRSTWVFGVGVAIVVILSAAGLAASLESNRKNTEATQTVEALVRQLQADAKAAVEARDRGFGSVQELAQDLAEIRIALDEVEDAIENMPAPAFPPPPSIVIHDGEDGRPIVVTPAPAPRPRSTPRPRSSPEPTPTPAPPPDDTVDDLVCGLLGECAGDAPAPLLPPVFPLLAVLPTEGGQ